MTQVGATPTLSAATDRVWRPLWPAVLVAIPVLAVLLFRVSPGEAVLGGVLALGLMYSAVRWHRRAAEQTTRAQGLAAALDAEREKQARDSGELTTRLAQMQDQLRDQAESAARVEQRSERLQRFTAQMLDRVSTAGAVNMVVEEGRRALEAAVAAVAVSRDGEEPEVTVSHGAGDDVLVPSREYRGATPLMDALHGGAPIWIENDRALHAAYPGLGAMRDGAAQESGTQDSGTQDRAAQDGDAQGAQHRSWAALPLQLDGRRVGALALAFDDPVAFTAADCSFMMLIAQQCAQAIDRARLHDMELRARVRAEFAERRLALLAEASGQLSQSLDYSTSVTNLSRIVVPEIADWCVVHLMDNDGTPRLVALAHSDPDKVALRRAIEERYPPSITDQTAFAQVMRTGQLVHIEPMPDAYTRQVARDEYHLGVLRSLKIRSQLSVPLLIEDRVYGVVTLGNAESGRLFSDSDITLAIEIARRAGHAVENARLYQAASHASEAKSDFLAVMSHELRTPLNAIMGYSDLLLMGVPDEVPGRARRQVERIRSASTSLLQLVDEVLSFSRIEAGKEDIRISPVDISALLRDCCAMIEPLAAEKGLVVSIDVPPDAIKVISDERKIRQILTNLLSNAVKFTEQGNVELAAFSREAHIVIEVRDTGIGIAHDNLELIFDPFWQAEQTATRRFGGTGLGLGVARKLAKLLEGHIEVCSALGSGSVFRLILPVHTPGLQRPA